MSGEKMNFPITSQGTNVNFFQNGAGYFTKQEGYQIQFGSNNGDISRFIASNPNRFMPPPSYKVVGGGAIFAIKDSGKPGDQDYNDSAICLEWYETVG